MSPDGKPSTQTQVCTWIRVALALQPHKSKCYRNCNTMDNTHSATIQEQLLQELQYNEQHTFWHLNNGAEFEEKSNMTFQFFFFYPPRPIIYLLLLKDLFLTGLRFRNRNSQRGQPTLLAICSWHFLLASLHFLGQMFSIFCGLLIFLYCLFRAVLQNAWSDVMLSLGWSGPSFPTFFKGFLTRHWHISFQRNRKVFRLCSLFWIPAAEAQYLLFRNILLFFFFFTVAKLRALRLCPRYISKRLVPSLPNPP